MVVTGLPASGKTSLAHAISPPLGMPVLDKDDFLVSLFESEGVGDAAWRTRLSRRADEELIRRANAEGPAILVSWWRHPRAEPPSGTLIEWLSQLPGGCVEVNCTCSPAIAAGRFVSRTRHPGHLDAQRELGDVRIEFERHAVLGPVGFGPLVSVSTERAIDVADVVRQIRHHASARETRT